MEQLVPIFICAIMPIAIVVIIYASKMYAGRQQTEIIIKAIEANSNLDTEKLVEAFRKPQRTSRQLLQLRLLRGCIFTLIGIVLIIFGGIAYVEWVAEVAATPLLLGFVSFAVGVSYLIVYFVTRKEAAKEDTCDKAAE